MLLPYEHKESEKALSQEKSMYLLVNSHSIESIIHNIDPAILGSQNKEGHQSLQHIKQS